MSENGANRILKQAMARLRGRREQSGLSQAQVAGHARVNPSYVGLLERGERIPSLAVLIAMCQAVELTPAELFADASPTTPKDSPELRQVRAMFARWSPAHRKAAVRVLKELDRTRGR